MTKKILAALTLSLGLGFGASAAYAQTAITVGTAITDQECAVLDEDVSPSLSKGVHAAYLCVEADNLIRVSACHESGRKKEHEVDCAVVGEWDGSVRWNGTCTNPTDKVTITTTGKGFIGSNAGGSVSPAALTAACTSDGGDAAATALLSD